LYIRNAGNPETAWSIFPSECTVAGSVESNRRTGLIDALATCITDPRNPSRIRHDVKTLLAQRVHGIAMGYEDGNDHQALCHDPIMQMLAGFAPERKDPLASPPTLCRFENWVAACLQELTPRGKTIGRPEWGHCASRTA